MLPVIYAWLAKAAPWNHKGDSGFLAWGQIRGPVMTVLDVGGGGNLKYIVLQVEPASTLFKPQAAHKRECQTRPRFCMTSPVKGHCACWSLNPSKSKYPALLDPILHLLM